MKELDIFAFLKRIAGSRVGLVNLKKCHAAHSAAHFRSDISLPSAALRDIFYSTFLENPAEDSIWKEMKAIINLKSNIIT